MLCVERLASNLSEGKNDLPCSNKHKKIRCQHEMCCFWKETRKRAHEQPRKYRTDRTAIVGVLISSWARDTASIVGRSGGGEGDHERRQIFDRFSFLFVVFVE